MGFLDDLYLNAYQLPVPGGGRNVPPTASNILLVYEPATDNTNAWINGSEVALTSSGTVTYETKGSTTPNTAAVLADGAKLSTSTVPFTDIRDETAMTIHVVQASNPSAGTGTPGNSRTAVERSAAPNTDGVRTNLSASSGAITNVFVGGSSFGPSAGSQTLGVCYVTAFELDGTTAKARLDATASAGSTISGTSTGDYDEWSIGSASTAGSTVFYVLITRAVYDSAIQTWLASQFPVGEQVYDPLAGSIFDFNPHVSMTTDQSSNAASLTNSGSYTADTDVLAKSDLKRVQFNGTNVITATCPSEIADYGASLPFTVYTVVRSDEADEAAAIFSIYDSGAASTNRCFGQLVNNTVRTNRQRIDNASGSGLEDDVNAARAPGTMQILSYTFYSTSQGRKSLDTNLGSLQNYSAARDPANNFDTIEIGGLHGGNVWDGDIFRVLVFDADADQDILDELYSVYIESNAAGDDLTAPSGGTIEFDYFPSGTGDFASGRDSSGGRVHGTLLPAGQFPTFTRSGSAGFPDFDEANDESITFTYPGAATLSACANDKLCMYVVFPGDSSSGTDTICGIGDYSNGSNGDRGWMTNNQFGSVTGQVKDTGSVTTSDSGGNHPTSSADVVMALYMEYDAVSGMIVGCADSAEAMTTTQNASAVGDVNLDTVGLATDYNSKASSLFNGAIKRLVIVEGANYDTTFAQAVLDSIP